MNKILSVFKVLLLEFVASALLLCLVALIMYKAGLSQQTARILVILVYVVATFLGGLVMGKAQKHKRLVWGLVAGGLYFAVLLLVSFALNTGYDAENNAILAAVCCMLGGCFGGMMS